MGIDDIILNEELCNRLYEKVLVNTAISPVHISFEGKNQKKILVAYDQSGKLKKEDREMLEKLLAACQFSVDDIALINISTTELTIAKIIEHLHTTKAILFGIPSLSIGWPIEDVEEKITVYNNCTFLRTAPLGVLNKNIEKKKALWTALKGIFQL